MEQTPSPCKTFAKKKAITCYKLLFTPESSRFAHFELLRITNTQPGEYYVVPIESLQKEVSTHISYHKSAAFHWKLEDGSRLKPRDGEADARRAKLMSQAVDHLSGRLDGYCIAKGRDVSDEALAAMLDIMDGYIIPPLRALRVFESLKQKKTLTIPMMRSPYQLEAQRALSAAAASGERKSITPEELLRAIRNSVGTECKIFQLDPKPARYMIYSEGTMTQIMAIAGRMVVDKMSDKPSAFWLKGIRSDPS